MMILLIKVIRFIRPKLANALADTFLTIERGEARRGKHIAKALKYAPKARKTNGHIDEGVLKYYAGYMKSDRLKESLK